jgi:hypothetical protein
MGVIGFADYFCQRLPSYQGTFSSNKPETFFTDAAFTV